MRLSENALFPKLFVILKKLILVISTICLWLCFQVFLDFEQNCYPRTASYIECSLLKIKVTLNTEMMI